MSHLFSEYAPFKGELAGRNRGVMVSIESGTSTGYALNNIQERGRLFIAPQENVYAGMIVGENARPDDLPVNPCKAKHLTNMRSQGEGKGIQLEAPLRMTLERPSSTLVRMNWLKLRQILCVYESGFWTLPREKGPRQTWLKCG
jgi:GTP-binding protein